MRRGPDIGLKAILVCFLFLVLAGLSAAEIKLNNVDDEIWMQDDEFTVEGELKCGANSTIESFNIDGPIGDPLINRNGNSFSSTINTDTGFGEYSASLKCSNSSEESVNFSVYRLEVQRESVKKSNIYKGDELKINFNINVKGGENVFDVTSAEAVANLIQSESVTLDPEFTKSDGSTVKAKVSSEVPEGDNSLEAGIKYSPAGSESFTVWSFDSNGNRFETVEVEKTWSFSVSNRTPSGTLNYENLEDLSLDVSVRKKGEPVPGLTNGDFFVTVEDEEGDVVKSYDEENWLDTNPLDSSGNYRLKVREGDVPSLKIGKYKWIVGIDRDGARNIAKIPVYRYMKLEGKITDATGKPVNPKITVDDGSGPKNIPVDSGVYKGNLLPGEYNFTLDFSEAEIKLEDVKMDQNVKGSIGYDTIPIGQVKRSLEGLSVLNAVGIVFGYPHQSAKLEMDYDSQRAGFQNIEVLQCKQWRLVQRKCFGEWEAVNSSEVEVYPTVGRIDFDADPINVEGRKKLLSAYLVVRNTELRLERVNFNGGRFRVGGSQGITGQILTPSGEPVEDVAVNISVVKGEKTVTETQATTGPEGNFGGEVQIPDKQGSFDVKLDVNKEPYIGFETRLDQSIETFIQREITVEVPDGVEFEPGEDSEVRFDIINDGQRPVKDVKIRIQNLKNSWYEFARGSWDSINPGGSREAVMSVDIPESYCRDTCTKYPTFKVKVLGQSGEESLSDIKSIQAVVSNQDQSSQQSSEQAQTNNPQSNRNEGSSLPDPVRATGDFLEKRSSLNVALGLAAVFLLSLGAAIKKRKSSEGRNPRGGRGQRESGVHKPNLSESNDTGDQSEGNQQEQKQEEAKSRETEKQENESEDVSEQQGSVKCDICGEEFDTESGKELHRQAMH